MPTSSWPGSLAYRLVGLADDPSDEQDTRLRKRVGVVAGYISVIGPLTLPALAPGVGLTWIVAATVPTINAVNLAVLWRTKRFDRYVVVLILTAILLPALVELVLGGMTGSSAGIVFAFLGPVYAILALGPWRATRWFILFLLVLAGVILLDPLYSSTIAPQPYGLRLIFYASNIGVPLTITFALLRYTDIRRRAAQARADELLTNAIPIAIAARLKQGEQRIAESYPATTVLFADLAGFTPWAQKTDPVQVVSFLDQLFSAFDELAARIGIEKIKTIGDAYMAVAGAPGQRADHAEAALELARGMLAIIKEERRQQMSTLELRIGLASGSVVGGVIGQRRILFDLWGDTVNTAARMESSGVAGRIHLSQSTRDLLGDRYQFETRAALDVKGLGRMTTYLLVE